MAGDGPPHDIDAEDFGAEDFDDDVGALDFLVVDHDDSGDESNALATELETDTTDEAEQHDDAEVPLYAVTNPPGTVTVSTFMDGRIQHIDLSPKVATMTESDLSEEILVIARLATQEAKSAQYAYMLDGMRQQGHDDVATRDFLTRDLDLPSPQDAQAERAEVFATRYRYDHD